MRKTIGKKRKGKETTEETREKSEELEGKTRARTKLFAVRTKNSCW